VSVSLGQTRSLCYYLRCTEACINPHAEAGSPSLSKRVNSFPPSGSFGPESTKALEQPPPSPAAHLLLKTCPGGLSQCKGSSSFPCRLASMTVALLTFELKMWLPHC
jgi:hypothetical protein